MVLENIITALSCQNGNKALDDVSASVILSSIHVLIESADQVFKDVSHLNGIVSRWIQVKFRESFYNSQKAAALIHRFDMIGKLQLLHDVLDIRRKAFDIIVEVLSQLVRFVLKLFQIIVAGVVKLKARFPFQSQCRNRRILLICFYNSCFCRSQRTFKSSKNGHGNNYIPVFIRHVSPS